MRFAIPKSRTAAKPAAKRAAPVAKSKASAVKKTASKPTKAATKKPPAARKLSSKATSALDKQCAIIARALDDNKAENIVMLDLAAKCSFADRMVVASGRSPRHVSALADYVADALKKNGHPLLSIEGKDSSDWVLIDAGNVIVHIFRPEVRQFYNIEKMWAIATP